MTIGCKHIMCSATESKKSTSRILLAATAFSIFSFLLLSLSAPVWSFKTHEKSDSFRVLDVIDPQEGDARIDQAREYLLSSNNEDFDKAAYLLRKIVVDEQEMQLINAFYMFGIMHKLLADEYGVYGDSNQYDPRRSLGLMYISDGLIDPGLQLLIAEASLLHMEAQLGLRYIYKNGFKNIPKHNSRILKFYKQTANEGIPRSMLSYGEILLLGLGVPADPEEGIKLLKESALEESEPLLKGYPHLQQ